MLMIGFPVLIMTHKIDLSAYAFSSGGQGKNNNNKKCRFTKAGKRFWFRLLGLDWATIATLRSSFLSLIISDNPCHPDSIGVARIEGLAYFRIHEKDLYHRPLHYQPRFI